MAEIPDNDSGSYALDQWLRKFGLWRGASLRKQTEDERKAALADMDFSKALAWSRGSYDPDGHQLVSLTSHTTYDPKTGIFDDKIVYWRHAPWDDNAKAPQSQDQYVIQIRGMRDPRQKKDEIPSIIPEQIWLNGSQMFDGRVHGGPHDPARAEYIKLFNRISDLSKRVKERLNDPSAPLYEVGRDFASLSTGLNLSKAALGASPALRGIGDKGWDVVEGLIHRFFTKATMQTEQKITLRLPAIKAKGEDLTPGAKPSQSADVTPLERLHVVNGHYLNTVEPSRGMMADWDEAVSSLHTGISYVGSVEYEFDKAKNRHIYRHIIFPDDQLNGARVPAPFDVLRLEYSQSGDSFTLEDAAFMDVPFKPKNPQEKLALIGLAQACGNDLACDKFPDYKNHIYRHRLQDHIQEMGLPPLLEETGGDFGWIPFVGHSFQKDVDIHGDNLGGGNAWMSRGVNEQGEISEVMALLDVAWLIGGPDSDYSGAQANFMKHREALRRGGIFISHDHFDHATLEFLAKQTDENGNGFLKGMPVICRQDVAYIIKQRLTKQGVSREHYPDFITYERVDGTHDPRLIKLSGEKHYAFPCRDESGNVRIWAQICANGSLHSAETDMFAFTGVYKGIWKDTYLTASDSLGIRPHGWKFKEQGQLALAEIPEVDGAALRASIKNPDQLYIALEEPTNVTSDGFAPTIEDFKDTFRNILKALPPGHAVSHHTFSTSHLEIRATREVCNEPEILRNFTSLGANAELRDTCMNIHGVDPFTDLREIEIPAHLLPQEAFDTALEAVHAYVAKTKAKAKSVKALEGDAGYKVFAEIAKIAEAERKAGQARPPILYDTFFSGNHRGFDDMAVSLGFPRLDKPRSGPAVVAEALDKLRKKYREDLISIGVNHKSDVKYYMLRSLAVDGRVAFKTKGGWNDKNMADAILRGQKTVSRHAGRDSQEGHSFRNNPGSLLVLSTGATGSADEDTSSLAKFSRGESSYDHDETTRSTGYRLDDDNLILFVTQTPSMGEGAETAQDALIRDIVNNRGNTVFRAFKGGFYIHNPKEHLGHYMKAFGDLGWKPTWDGANNRIRIPRPFHVHGHAFYADIQKRMADPRYKARLLEANHLAGHVGFKRWQEIAERTGRRTSITDPKNFVFYQARENEKGEAYLAETASLTPSYWLVQVRRKFGLQYGGIVRMVLASVMRRTGSRAMDALEARSGADGYVADHSALQRANDWLKPRNAQASARQAGIGPALSDVQGAGGKPPGPAASSLVHQYLWRSGRFQAPEKDLG